MKPLTLSHFDYDLPPQRIAQEPLPIRSHSRLLSLKRFSEHRTHHRFYNIVDLLKSGDLLLFNNTKVIPARLFGRKSSGGKIEMLLERIIDDTQALVQIRASKSPGVGMRLHLEGDLHAEVLSRQGEFFQVQFHSPQPVETLFTNHGHLPLPSYIQRDEMQSDQDRYQTIYAEHAGAVAAPTAGLHFDDGIFTRLHEKGIETDYVTLHVGAGTFQPVRVETITDHHMHKEWIDVPQTVCDKINATKARGNRVIAVGTTTVRCLETAALQGSLQAYEGETDIFIYPGFEFKVTDGIITNFHLPKSTLLMMISAFGGYEHVMQAYREAIAKHYRFYSYGDSMLIA